MFTIPFDIGYSRRKSILYLSIPFRPPRIRAITFISYLPDLLYGVRAVLDFVLIGKLVRPKSASYLVLVHQTEILPPASFRFHVTVDTLAFG